MKEQSGSWQTASLDYRAIFDHIPSPYLVLDPSFTIVAQNDAHARVTNTRPEDTVGRLLFEVFPDNPNDSNADGLSALRQSLLAVLKTRAMNEIPVLHYAIRRPVSEGGGYEERYWRVVNMPVLGPDGYVTCIINQADDITELTQLRQRLGIVDSP
jgi:PAS domain S-box-containing protein